MASRRDLDTLKRLIDKGGVVEALMDDIEYADVLCEIVAAHDEGRTLHGHVELEQVLVSYDERAELTHLLESVAKYTEARTDLSAWGVVGVVAEALHETLPEPELSTYDNLENRKTLVAMMNISYSGQNYEEVLYELIDYIR